MLSRVESGDTNRAYLHINGDWVEESEHITYSGWGAVYSTGGREVTREFSQGDNIELKADTMDVSRHPGWMDGYYNNIVFCAEYVPKM